MGGLHWFLLQATQGSVEGLEGNGHPIQGIQSIEDTHDMQVSILIDHFGIVPGHPLQGHKHSFLNLGGIVTLLKGVFNLATPIPIGKASSLVVSRNNGKLRHLFLGP